MAFTTFIFIILVSVGYGAEVYSVNLGKNTKLRVNHLDVDIGNENNYILIQIGKFGSIYNYFIVILPYEQLNLYNLIVHKAKLLPNYFFVTRKSN